MMKRLAILLLIVMAAAVGYLAIALQHHPDLAAYEALWLPPAEAEQGPLRVTYLGVSSLLISDGETHFMTDGFFSRPGLLDVVATRLAPDQERIAAALERLSVERLAAVIVLHSHYDHVMDAAAVAERTNALLIGSESTANVGIGWGLPKGRIGVVEDSAELELGKFKLTLIKSRHFPHGKAMGTIDAPLMPPARATDYREGGSYSLLVAHPSGSLLIQGSAGFVSGALKGRQADTVLLGVGLLGSKDEAYMNAYWAETVQTVGAKRVIPIHWDDFFKPLKERPDPFSYLLDDLDASMHFIRRKADEEGVDVRFAPAWRAIDPFGNR